MRSKIVLSLIVGLLLAAQASATVTARVDRPAVDLNESFTLEIIVDGNSDTEPDTSVLEQDFYIGQSSQLSNTSIINGQINRSRTWTYMLMAKRTGAIQIPSIRVGSEQSNPVSIAIREPSYAPPGEADVFVSSEVDFEETYVQAQILYTIKIYRAVPTRQPSLREPQFSGAEALAEIAGDERSYAAVLDGKEYNVVERVIAVYPQESGEIEISPARFEARVLRDGRITGRKVFASESHKVTVLPMPAPPAEFPDATWLPARDVQITEEWSSDPDELKAGQPLTRRIQVSALGQLETQIPAVEMPPVDGLNVYPDKPELSRIVESGGIRGTRKDQYAMIATGAGTVELPELKLPWWDIERGEWRVASLPERAISILSSGEAPPAPPPQEQDAAPADTAEVPGAAAAPEERGFWRLAAELLAAVWLLTVFAWWWSSRPKHREPREPAPVPIHKQQSKQLKLARKAALAGDDAELKSALIAWGKLQWPDDAPRSVGVLAERVSEPLASELKKLSGATYGAARQAWDGEALAKALRGFAVINDTDQAQQQDSLPPLMPGVS